MQGPALGLLVQDGPCVGGGGCGGGACSRAPCVLKRLQSPKKVEFGQMLVLLVSTSAVDVDAALGRRLYEPSRLSEPRVCFCGLLLLRFALIGRLRVFVVFC